MTATFEGWVSSKYLFDPIGPSRRGSPEFTGNGKAKCWEIFQTITHVENSNATQAIVWRGQSNAIWPLATRMQRFWESQHPGHILDIDAFDEQRESVYSEAIARGIGRTEIGTARVLHTFAELQHYGVPTHLLDVTEDALTALWFACQSEKTPKVQGNGTTEADGVLFAIDVSKMRSLTTSHTDREFVKVNKEIITVGNRQVTNLPIYLKSHVPNRRMAAQRAAFIVTREPVAPGKSGIDNYTIPPLKRFTAADADALRNASSRTFGQPRKIPFVAILIPHESKQWILKRLESGNKRSHETLFPDVLGLAQMYQSRIPSKT